MCTNCYWARGLCIGLVLALSHRLCIGLVLALSHRLCIGLVLALSHRLCIGLVLALSHRGHKVLGTVSKFMSRLAAPRTGALGAVGPGVTDSRNSPIVPAVCCVRVWTTLMGRGASGASHQPVVAGSMWSYVLRLGMVFLGGGGVLAERPKISQNNLLCTWLSS